MLNSNRLSAGPVMAQFEHEVAALHGCAYGLMLNSGTSALQVALAALRERHGWQDGDEVLVPAVTFVATSNVVLYNGLKPVFCDVEPDYFCIDPARIEERITERTRAIMPVHIGGLPCDMDPILEVAERHGLRMVEDSRRVVRRALQGSPRRLLRRRRLLLDVRRACHLDGRRRRLHDRRPRAADADEEPHEPRARRRVHADRRRHGRRESGRAGDSGAPVLVHSPGPQLPRDGDGGCARYRPAGRAACAVRPARGGRATR